MRQLVTAGGADEDRTVERLAKDRSAEVYLRHVNQPPRAQPEALKPFTVGAQRVLVVHARRDVGPVRRRQLVLRHGLEVEQLERLPHLGDHPALLVCRCGEDGARDFGESAGEWARGEKAKKGAAVPRGHLRESHRARSGSGREIELIAYRNVGYAAAISRGRAKADARVQCARRLRNNPHAGCAKHYASPIPIVNSCTSWSPFGARTSER